MQKFSFNKRAGFYDKYSLIQQSIAKKLSIYAKHIISQKDIDLVIDLGAGSGVMHRSLGDLGGIKFLAIDKSPKMLEIHRMYSKDIFILEKDFDYLEISDFINLDSKNLVNPNFREYKSQDLESSLSNQSKHSKNIRIFLISNCALQWSKDIQRLFAQIKVNNIPFAFSIITSNTFKNIHDILQTTSPLRDSEYLIKLFKKYFDGDYLLESKTLEFSNTLALMQSLRGQGLLKNRAMIDFSKINKLLKSEIKTLEYEVLYLIHALS